MFQISFVYLVIIICTPSRVYLPTYPKTNIINLIYSNNDKKSSKYTFTFPERPVRSSLYDDADAKPNYTVGPNLVLVC